MAGQLASVPEETITDFTAPNRPGNLYREAIRTVAVSRGQIRSAMSPQSGQSGSNYSSISGTSSSYMSIISSGSAFASASDFGADVLHQGRPSIHKVSSSLAKHLASVSEESATVSTAHCPPSNSYRESIRSVAWPEWRIISTLWSQSGQSGSSYSGASSSYMSKNSGCSSGSASAGAADFGANELTKIAQRMVSDGYTQRMFQAFKYGGERNRPLETWFVELDINWIFQEPEWDCTYGWQVSREKLLDVSAPLLQDLAERWIRALTIIVASIKELVAALHETPAVARFGKASISEVLRFAHNIIHCCSQVKLQPMLHMYICVSSASHDMSMMHHLISSEAQSIFNDIGSLLNRVGDRLTRDIVDTMMHLRQTLMKSDDSWAFEIPRGSEVHRNTRFMVDCIVSMRIARDSGKNSAQSHNTGKLHNLIEGTIDYVKDLLLQKSMLCLDPSLRYLFLLNNFYFVAQVSEPSISLDVELLCGHSQGLELIPECEKYMDSYLEVSWGHVMSCISTSNLLGPLSRWMNTSSLAKFQTAFHKTYLSQKFWKVPDPRLRDVLRRAINERVISGYSDYLKEHPELEKQVSSGSNSPQILEEMLGELFEG